MTFLSSPFAAYKLLAAELTSRGYTVSEEREQGRLMVSFTSPSGRVWKTEAVRIRYPFISPEARQLFDDKATTYQYVASRGVAVPHTWTVNHDEPFESAKAQQIIDTSALLIVKPNDSLSSRGLTLNINDASSLIKAVEHARSINISSVLIQKQVKGEEVRFIIQNGKVVGALLRQTPRVVGNGTSTVSELVAQENQARGKLVFPYISYPQLTSEIIDSRFFSDARILPEGEVLEFSQATMIRNGCSLYQILDQVHPTYIESLEKLAAGIQASFFVADYLIGDFRQPLGQDNVWFLEFNATPSLKLCYGCRDGKMFDVVPLIADTIEQTLK